jgi:outer membrane protein
MKYFIIVLLFSTPIYSQQILGLSYNISIPQGDMREFIDNTSYAGFGIEGRQFINEQISMGLSFGWSKFRQESQQVSGTTIILEENLLDSFPLVFNASYYMFDEATGFRPYAGFNAGVYFINARRISTQRSFQDKSLYFGVAPEIGFFSEMFYDINMLIFMRYNYTVKFSGPGTYPYFTLHFALVSVSIL